LPSKQRVTGSSPVGTTKFSSPTLNPIIRNGDLQTILGNFWSRPVTEDRFPLVRHLYRTDADTQVAVDEQLLPDAKAHAVLVHGLEGSSQGGYIRSLSRDLLEAGVAVHRFNMRSCGGTEHLCRTNYHAGQTCDLRHVLLELRKIYPGKPLFLIGYSLGGNASLKLAGEFAGQRLIDGVCGVSTPIDLARCCDRLNEPRNFIYQRRFVAALKGRIERRHALQPDEYDLKPLAGIRSIWEFDDAYTSKLFGFGTALNYFKTQSAGQFLEAIEVPCLVIQAKDDPMIPFEVYERERALHGGNRNIRFLPFETGGHVGFISKSSPRFWIDPIITRWVLEIGNKSTG
jgi:uncharacterized protein